MRVVVKGHVAAGYVHGMAGALTYDLRTLDGRYGCAWACLRILNAPADAFERADASHRMQEPDDGWRSTDDNDAY